MLILNEQQTEALRLAYEWYKSQRSQVFCLTGKAGTGKTTIVSALIDRLNLQHDEVLFMAYIGKAAMVLSLKGNNAKTIHASIYDMGPIPKRDEFGQPIMTKGRPVTRLGFIKKPCIGKNVKLLVIDEASMVNKDIAEDIMSFGLPMIALGDLNQLPPVFGDPYLLHKPDVILTQIMRQAEGNPIIRLADMALNGIDIPLGKYGDKCLVIPAEKVTDELMQRSSVILCAKNATRDDINKYYRKEIMGITNNFPIIGDKVICRKNNWGVTLPKSKLSLINGMIGFIEGIDMSTYKKGKIKIDFRPDFIEDEFFKDIQMDPEYPFMSYREKCNQPYNPFDTTNKFEFGYAITVHLSQGSQFPNVLMYDEKMGDREFYRKLTYTGITRASEGLVIAR